MTKETMTFKQKKWVKNSKNKYLRPGALAQICFHKSASKPCTDIGKKKIILGLNKKAANLLSQKDKIANTSKRTLENINSVQNAEGCHANIQDKLPMTPKASTCEVFESQSSLESLPMDLLVQIICHLHHDQLRAVFHVSRRIRKAVLLARQHYFNYTTPDRRRQQKLRTTTPLPTDHWPFIRKDDLKHLFGTAPHTPKAPRHGPRIPRPCPIDIKQIAAVLFQESALPKSKMLPSSPMPGWKSLASNRVLFCEDELCHAVAQNKLL